LGRCVLLTSVGQFYLRPQYHILHLKDKEVEKPKLLLHAFNYML
jgi:hypothetical protein